MRAKTKTGLLGFLQLRCSANEGTSQPSLGPDEDSCTRRYHDAQCVSRERRGQCHELNLHSGPDRHAVSHYGSTKSLIVEDNRGR